MALVKKSWQDHLTASFGQVDEAIRSRTGSEVLLVGGVMEGTATVVEHGDAALMHFDANQNLMVNIAQGEVVASLGTVDLVKAGTLDSIKNIVTGTIAAVTSVTNVAAGTVTAVNNIVTGTIASIGNVVGGTVTSIGNVVGGTVTSVGNIVAGTMTTLGTVGVLNAGSVVVTNGTVTPKDSVASAKATIVVTTPAAAGTLACTLTGLARYFTQITPALEGTGTATTRMVDSSGGTVMALAAQNEGVITCYGTTVPLTTDMSFVTTCDGTQSASRSIILDIHYEK